MSKASQHRVTRLLVVALTITGGVFLADSTVRGGLLKYKIFGMAVGGLMMLPAVVALVWRQRGLRFLRLCAFSLVPTVALLIVIESIMRVAGIGEMTVIEVVPSGRLGHVLKPGVGGAAVALPGEGGGASPHPPHWRLGRIHKRGRERERAMFW